MGAFPNAKLTCRVARPTDLPREMTMSSPVDEMMTPASPAMSEATANASMHEADASYGADEERLVQLAQQEAMLRLARAM